MNLEHTNIKKHSYPNNRTALVAYDNETGECVTKITINIPETEIESDEVIIKNYSENQGILDELVEKNIVSKPIRYLATGFVTVPVCKLKL